MVGPEAPQVVLGHGAGGHHVVHRPLQAAGGGERQVSGALLPAGTRVSLPTLPLPPPP